MLAKWTFESAAAFWRKHHAADTEIIWDRFSAAEAFLLSHKPKTSWEAEIMFDVLIAQGPDARGDELDQKALVRLRQYVRSLHRSILAAA